MRFNSEAHYLRAGVGPEAACLVRVSHARMLHVRLCSVVLAEDSYRECPSSLPPIGCHSVPRAFCVFNCRLVLPPNVSCHPQIPYMPFYFLASSTVANEEDDSLDHPTNDEQSDSLSTPTSNEENALLPPPEDPPPIAGVKRPLDDEMAISHPVKDQDGNTIVRSRSPRRSKSSQIRKRTPESENPTWIYRLKKLKGVALDALVVYYYLLKMTTTNFAFGVR